MGKAPLISDDPFFKLDQSISKFGSNIDAEIYEFSSKFLTQSDSPFGLKVFSCSLVSDD